MNKKRAAQGSAMQLERAQYEVEQAKKRFASTMGSLQYRLKPGTLVNNAWEGVREKSSEAADEALHAVNGLADGAVQAARTRPVAASGIAAAAVIFLARGQLRRAASWMFTRGEDKGIVRTKLVNGDENYDLTAPTVAGRTIKE
ncbi:MAG: hypothetical protein M3Q08_10700 [Pseudomonadota bacterium]|nr:hypothetical protein [Pseudomonadota bacterium]